MNKIEVMGRLKEVVCVNAKKMIWKDIKLDSDFIIDLAYDMLQHLGADLKEKKLKYKKTYTHEIVDRVKFQIKFEDENYEIKLTRDTFDNKILIGCEIKADNDNNELFNSVYNLKVKIIKFFLRLCTKSHIFILEDYNNEIISKNAYIEIHRIENKFRNILTRYLMKRYGSLSLSTALKKKVEDYSALPQASSQRYRTFKDINTSYCNLGFSDLPGILNLKDATCINQDGDSISSVIHSVREKLNNHANTDDIFKEIAIVEQLIKKSKNIFSEEENHSFLEFEESENDIRGILNQDFIDLWEKKLSKMRNTIAHNKPICKELYDDIIETCRQVDKKFDQCLEFIDMKFYSEESAVLESLEVMEMQKELEEEHYYIETKREEVGIEMSLSESYIETIITEKLESINNLIYIMSNLVEMRETIENISYIFEKIQYMDLYEENLELKYKIFNIINDKMNLNQDFKNINDLSTGDIVSELLFGDLDYEKAVDFYINDINYSSLEYFSMDFDITWYGIDNKEYRIELCGDVSPENGAEDELRFIFSIDDDLNKQYRMLIYYGDYMLPSEGYINDQEIMCLIDDVEPHILNTVERFKKISEILTLCQEQME